MSIIVVVVSENRNPVKTLAWVTVLLVLPMAGIILYLFFGRSIKNKRMISRRNRRRLARQAPARKLKPTRFGLSQDAEKLMQLTRSISGSWHYQGGDVEVFTDGREKFERLFADIDAAKRFVNIQYYIIEDDNLGTRLKEHLIAAARRGVKVRVIYDHVGSFKTRKAFFKELRSAGVEAYPFFRLRFPLLGSHINWRNHRKLCVIDGVAGYIGGMNVADRYIDGGENFKGWRDTHLRITGPAVGALQYSFAVDWNFMGRELIEEKPAEEPDVAADAQKSAPVGASAHLPFMQLLTSGPTSQWTNIAMLFTRAIAGAKQRVYIQTPYFLPTDGLLKALQTAALAGVDVRLMLPIRADSKMMTMASFSYISQCLSSGIKVYLYNAGMLHAKVVLVDDEFVSVGSTNFDFRSFEYNFEANLQVYSREFNSRMADIFQEDMESCLRVLPTEWRKRPFLKKAQESIIRLLAPIL